MTKFNWTPARERALKRLIEVPRNKALHCSGHLMSACWALAQAGYAENLGRDKWLGAFFKINDKGRAAWRKLKTRL